MRTVNTKRHTLALSLVAAGALTACGTASPGQPTAEPSGGSPSQGPSSHSHTSDAPTGSSLAGVKPCSLLSGSDAEQLGLDSRGKPGMSGSAPECTWQSGSNVLSVEILRSKGLAKFHTTGATQGQPIISFSLGNHKAKRQVDDMGNCGVGIGVAQHSRVNVIATLSDTSKACEAAKQAATLVEQHLPPAH